VLLSLTFAILSLPLEALSRRERGEGEGRERKGGREGGVLASFPELGLSTTMLQPHSSFLLHRRKRGKRRRRKETRLCGAKEHHRMEGGRLEGKKKKGKKEKGCGEKPLLSPQFRGLPGPGQRKNKLRKRKEKKEKKEGKKGKKGQVFHWIIYFSYSRRLGGSGKRRRREKKRRKKKERGRGNPRCRTWFYRRTSSLNH